MDNGRTLIEPSTSLRRKNFRGVWPIVRLTAIWNYAFHHMEHWNTLNFDHTYLTIPNVKSIDSLTKNKRIILFTCHIWNMREVLVS
jgi:hypothetical protein